MTNSNDAEIHDREAYITGKPQRIPTLESKEALELARQQTANLRFAVTGSTERVEDADIPEMLLALMCHPELYERVSAVSIQTMAKGSLSHRDRELVILRTGWLCQAPWEWGEHVALAKMMGLSGDDIEQVTVGSSSPHWSEHERALVKAAEELHDDAMISDETWEILAKSLSHKQLFELTVVAGHYTLVAYFQNSMRFRVNPGNQGLKAR